VADRKNSMSVAQSSQGGALENHGYEHIALHTFGGELAANELVKRDAG
jgi:hypothetical protein